MKKPTYVFFASLLFYLSVSCNLNTVDKSKTYNQKANELLIQVAEESNCDCIAEIPKQSLIEVVKIERPKYDIESRAIKLLNLKSKSNLDSLVNISRNFELDTNLLRIHKLKWVSEEELMKTKVDNGRELFKKCHKGILCPTKPILDSELKKAILDYSLAFMCSKGPVWFYEYREGKWKSVEK